MPDVEQTAAAPNKKLTKEEKEAERRKKETKESVKRSCQGRSGSRR